jgi:hypothetical protein
LSRTATHRFAAVVSGAAVAGLLATSFLASPASADPDPTNPGTPISGVSSPAFLYAGVGADADAELMQNAVLQYNSTVTTPSATTPLLESFDATNPQTGATEDSIVTKPGCAGSPRPNGTGEGQTALTNDAVSTSHPEHLRL